MGLFDWLGPTSLTKRRSVDAPPATAEQKIYAWTQQDYGAALTVRTLVHGPGATELLAGQRGDDGNSAVFACLQAIAAAYVEAPLTVYKQIAPKEREPQFEGPLQTFLDFPNPELDLLEILAWVQWAKHVDGNAYLRKIRAGDAAEGNVVQIWPISPCRVEPKTIAGSGDLVSYYRYYDRPGHHEDIPRENIIHFRMGLDDKDHRLGCAPLKRLLREVSSDDQATRYADRLLANLAINGLSLEFADGRDPIPQAQADELKARIQGAYSGDNVGAVSVLSPGAKLVQHGFSPEQMDMKTLHRVPEERISAVLRVPAIVAGLGAGLDRSTFANYAEANQSFIENTILGLYRADDKKLTHSLAIDFTSDKKISIAHDISQMRALQDDEDKKATRLAVYVAAGILDIDEARAEIGRDPRPEPEPVAEPAAAPAPGGALPATRGRLRFLTLPPRDADDLIPDNSDGRYVTEAEFLTSSRTRETKAIDDLPVVFDDLKAERLTEWQTALEAFLTKQLGRVNARLRAGTTAADGLVVEGEAQLLGDRLLPLQTELLSSVSKLVVAELGIDFSLDDAATRAYLQSAGSNIVGITDYTRERVAAALIEGQAAGEGIPELARRLRDLPAFGPARAATVARTELANATTLSAVSSYIASGVVHGCRILDGDSDAGCAAMNGRTFPLDQLPPTLGHPNCVRAFSPIVDAAEVERSA